MLTCTLTGCQDAITRIYIQVLTATTIARQEWARRRYKISGDCMRKVHLVVRTPALLEWLTATVR